MKTKEDVAVDRVLEGLTGIFQVGKSYYIRGSYHWVGTVREVRGKYLILSPATWSAEGGRYSDVIAGKAEMNETEAVPLAVYNLEDMIDAVEWKHPIPQTK